jgi:hypothetical protein
MYFIQIADEATARSYKNLGLAKSAANKMASSKQVELDVVDADGNVAFIATYVAGRYFFPFERVENATFTTPHIEGFRVAYTRRRIQATVYRALDEKSWLVRDGRTGGTLVVPTTKAACHLTTEMRLGRTL